MDAEPRQQPRSYKLDDERDFNVAATQTQRMFERGFLRLWESVPTDAPTRSLPPPEHYEHIAASFKAKNIENTLLALKGFADYLYKNGFDDPEEFDRLGIGHVILQICEVSPAENPLLGPTAFHVMSLLQTRGPQFPGYLQSADFIHWCFRFLVAASPILYYPLTCLMNHCALGERETFFVQELIPVASLRLQFDATQDIAVRETILDLGCRYSKVSLRPDMALGLIDLCRIALLLGESAYYSSTFWILVRLLRHYRESIVYIMCPDVLSNANAVLKGRSPGPLIPGMIFTSYVYELGFKYPRFSVVKLLNILSDPPDVSCQRQACRTLTKIIVRRQDMIPMLLAKGLFYHIACALDWARLRDKFEIALLACDVIELGGPPATARVFQTKCVNLWVGFLDWENDDITIRAIQTLDRIFEAAEELPEEIARRIHARFLSVGGLAAIEKLTSDGNEEISGLASSFFESYLAELNSPNSEPEQAEEEEEHPRLE
jgi:hypothetical protein